MGQEREHAMLWDAATWIAPGREDDDPEVVVSLCDCDGDIRAIDVGRHGATPSWAVAR